MQALSYSVSVSVFLTGGVARDSTMAANRLASVDTIIVYFIGGYRTTGRTGTNSPFDRFPYQGGQTDIAGAQRQGRLPAGACDGAT
jgi:hypothetical protein